MKRILLTTIIIAIISGAFAQKKGELVQLSHSWKVKPFLCKKI